MTKNNPPACPSCGAPLEEGRAICLVCARTTESLSAPPAERSDESHAADPAAGQQFGEYRILRTIGRGGMGTVYEAWQESMRRRVALKVLEESAFPSAHEVSRFEREAWIGGRLTHPNVVRVYEQGVEGTRRWIAMELVEGPSLHATIPAERESARRKEGSGSTAARERIRRMVGLFLGVVDALDHIHGQGIIHRDIKPLNLLLTKDGGRLLLTDFGLARDEEASRITRRGDFLGTIRYMSPEQLLAHRVRVDHRSDIWSLGVSLYEAVTLDLPYTGKSEEAYLSAVTTKEPVRARLRSPSVPRDLETILMKCLERDPERRYASAAQLRDDLRRFLDDRPVLARRPGVAVRVARFAKRNRKLIAAAVVAAALAGALSGLVVHQVRIGRDFERIESTLKRLLEEEPSPNRPPLNPEGIVSDWPQLQKLLQREVRRDPPGHLGRLALRAAVGLWARVPPYAPLTDFQGAQFNHTLNFDPGIEYHSLAILEGSWDGGPWRRVTRSVRTSPGSFVGIEFEQFLSAVELSPGPHRLDLRASLLLLRHARTPKGVLDHWQRAPASADRTTLWPSIPETEILSRETRKVGAFAVTLFREYPSDFPRQVTETHQTGTIESRFRPRLVRYICLRIPEGAGSPVYFDLRREVLKLSCNSSVPSSRLLLAGFEIVGRWQPDDVLPIAAEVSVRTNLPGLPLFSFDFALSDWMHEFKPREPPPECSMIGVSSLDNERGETVTGYLQPFRWLADTPTEGVTTGLIELVPSRDVALGTHWLDRYLATRKSFPVQVEVVILDGRRTSSGR